MKVITAILQGIVSIAVLAFGVYLFLAFCIVGGIAGSQEVINEGMILAILMAVFSLLTIVAIILGLLKKKVPTTILISIKLTLFMAICAYLLTKADASGHIWLIATLLIEIALETISVVELNKKELENNEINQNKN